MVVAASTALYRRLKARPKTSRNVDSPRRVLGLQSAADGEERFDDASITRICAGNG